MWKNNVNLLPWINQKRWEIRGKRALVAATDVAMEIKYGRKKERGRTGKKGYEGGCGSPTIFFSLLGFLGVVLKGNYFYMLLQTNLPILTLVLRAKRCICLLYLIFIQNFYNEAKYFF